MQKNGQFIIAIVFSLISLFLSLSYTDLRDRFTQQQIQDFYSGYSWNLVKGNGYKECVLGDNYGCDVNPYTEKDRKAYRLPGYPLLIASVMVIDIDNFLPLLILVQCLLVSAIVGITVSWAYTWGKTASITTGVILLLTIGFYDMASRMLTEIWFTFLLLCSVRYLSIAKTKQQIFIAGALLGITLITRGVLLFTLPFIFLWLFPKRNIILFIVGIILVIAPWSIRNYLVFDAVVPFSTGSGQVLSGSNNPEIYNNKPGYWISYSWELEGDISQLSELERDRSRRNSAIEYMRSLPIHVLIINVALKVFALFGVYDDPMWHIGTIVYLLIFTLTITQAILKPYIRNVICKTLQNRTLILFLILILGLVLNTFVFWGGWRFRLPYEPYLAIIAGILLSNILRRRSSFESSIR